jgi:threonine dehydrogenase-like Zn-dependent dehydrogenase
MYLFRVEQGRGGSAIVTTAAPPSLLDAAQAMKKKGRVGLVAVVVVSCFAIPGRVTVRKLIFVKATGGESPDLWVHTVLMREREDKLLRIH